MRYYTHNTITGEKLFYDNALSYLDAINSSPDTTKGYKWSRGTWYHDRDGSAYIPTRRKNPVKVGIKHR